MLLGTLISVTNPKYVRIPKEAYKGNIDSSSVITIPDDPLIDELFIVDEWVFDIDYLFVIK